MRILHDLLGQLAEAEFYHGASEDIDSLRAEVAAINHLDEVPAIRQKIRNLVIGLAEPAAFGD